MQPWLLGVSLAAFCLLAVGGLLYYRTRHSVAPGELVRHLPDRNSAMLHFDIDGLRRSGLLELLAGRTVALEPDYEAFVRRTGFDYRTDLDSVLIGFGDRRVYFLLRGRFNWKLLSEYATIEGGQCRFGYCQMPASRPARFISFFALRPSVMAMAVADDGWAAHALKERRPTGLEAEVPPQPVWTILPAASLRGGDWMPAGTRAFASLLANAQRAVLALGADGRTLEALLSVDCGTPQQAERLAKQLTELTETLRRYIAREDQTPNPRDLSSVLTSGTFRSEGNRVLGRWPISRQFLANFTGDGS